MNFGKEAYIKHNISISPIGEGALHSNRPLYRVECHECEVVIHEETTAPELAVVDHFKGRPGYSRPMTGYETRLSKGMQAAVQILDIMRCLDKDGGLFPTYTINEDDDCPLENAIKTWLEAGAPMPSPGNTTY